MECAGPLDDPSDWRVVKSLCFDARWPKEAVVRLLVERGRCYRVLAEERGPEWVID
jgi:hypothetical protein